MRTALLTMLLSFGVHAAAQSIQTTVQPLPGEDIAQSCHYDLHLLSGNQHIDGVLALYDRGPQITAFYSDPDVATLATKYHLALLLAHQCNSIHAPGGPEEMDMDPSHGIGRALFTALDQFAQQTGHAELSSARLVLLGFSGTGALFAHFVGYAPQRVIAAVLIHPAHYEPVALSHVALPPNGLAVPELIFAGGADKIATTQSPYDYFLRFYQQGAPWTFVPQNDADHFRVSVTKPLILAWLDDVLSQRKPKANQAWTSAIAKCPTDKPGSPTWNICNAAIVKPHTPTPANMLPAGWLPSQRFAEQWLHFVKP